MIVISHLKKVKSDFREKTFFCILRQKVNRKHLFNALSQIPPEQRTGYVLPLMAEYYLNKKRDRINRMIKKHFESCRIKTVKEGTGEGTGKRAVIQYGFHSLRYSYISHHAEAGTPQAIIQANAGHANPAVTEHYTKISDNAALKVASAIDISPIRDGLLENNPEAEREKLRQFIESGKYNDIKRALEILKNNQLLTPGMITNPCRKCGRSTILDWQTPNAVYGQPFHLQSKSYIKSESLLLSF